MTSTRCNRISLALLALCLAPTLGAAQTTKLLDATGDGQGNGLDFANSIAVDAAGNAYVSGFNSDNVFKVTAGGVITEIIDAGGDGQGNQLEGPQGVAVDAAGNVFVAGSHSDNVFKITPGGVITVILDSSTNFLNFPRSVVVDAAGNVYVAGASSSNAFKIAPDGTRTELINSSGDGLGNPLTFTSAIDVDSAGNVYVTGDSSNNAFKITPGGTITEIFESLDAFGVLLRPHDVAVDGSGDVYVLGDRVYKVTPGGQISVVLPVAPGVRGFGLTRLDVDSAENVYVSGWTTNRVFRVQPDGLIVESKLPGSLISAPWEVTLDAADDLYVSGLTTHRVVRVRNPAAEPFLVARWNLDGDVLAANFDLWDGAPNPGLTFVPGRKGMAARFDHAVETVATACDCAAPTACVVAAADSVDHFDSTTKTSALQFSGGLSVMAWILPEDPVGRGVILDHSQACCGTCFEGFTFGRRSATGALYLELSSSLGSLVAETTSGVDGPCWSHVAVTWDGDPSGGVKFFVDGSEVTNTTSVSPGFQGLDESGELPVRIGASHADANDQVESFDGLIDEVSLWLGTLPQSEVQKEINKAGSNGVVPTFDPGGPCGTTMTAFVGVPLSFDVTASDCDVGDIVTILPHATLFPPGATLTSTPGNPTTATFEWTPTNADLGTHAVRFRATQQAPGQSICNVTIEVGIPDPAALVAQWELDGDFTAQNEPDWDGVPSSGVTFEAGPASIGLAALFEASQEMVTTSCDCSAPLACTVAAADTVDHVDSMELTSAADFGAGLSVMGWIQPRVGRGSGVIVDHSQACCGTCFEGFTFGWEPTTGELFLDLGEGGLVARTSPGLVEPSCWTHVAVAWDGDLAGGVTFYVDGSQVGTTVTVSPGFGGLSGTGLLPLRIGASHAEADGTVEGAGGLIDHLSLWQGDLHPAQVLQDYDPALSLAPPVFEPPSPCDLTLMASVGVPLSFDVGANACGDTLIFLSPIAGSTPTGLPLGGTLTPFSAVGNPVSATFDWTPTNADVGTHVVRFRATIPPMFLTECVVTIEVAECFLLVAQSAGSEAVNLGGYTYATQVQGLSDAYPVTMELNPELSIGQLGRPGQSPLQAPSTAPLVSLPLGGGRAIANLPVVPGQLLFAQVVMWNPQVFPANPEQWSRGLAVYVLPSLDIVSLPYGSENGIQIRAVRVQDANGKPAVKFPFAIDGL